MESPLLIDISKTQPQYVYPLVYERDFPDYAYEQVKQTGKFACSDDGFDESTVPTCGWQVDPLTGSKLVHSQGFCCECDLINIFDSVEATRGSECDLINMGSSASSAHCLRFSEADTWFEAYTMQPPKLTYTIEIFFSLPVSKDSGSDGDAGKDFREETIKLGDFQRNARSETAVAELVGNLVGF